MVRISFPVDGVLTGERLERLASRLPLSKKLSLLRESRMSLLTGKLPIPEDDGLGGVCEKAEPEPKPNHVLHDVVQWNSIYRKFES